MKKAYRMYKRGNVYYIQNNQTREQRSLGTTDKETAQKLLDTENQARQAPALNLQLGKVYMTNADPKMATRSWQEAMNELGSHGKESTQKRCQRELKSKAFDIIRNKIIIETTGEDWLFPTRLHSLVISRHSQLLQYQFHPQFCFPLHHLLHPQWISFLLSQAFPR